MTKVSCLRKMPDGSYVSVSDIKRVAISDRGNVQIQYKHGATVYVQTADIDLVVKTIKTLESNEQMKAVSITEDNK